MALDILFRSVHIDHYTRCVGIKARNFPRLQSACGIVYTIFSGFGTDRIQLNTSNLGQNLIEFTPTTAVAASTTSSGSSSLGKRDDPLSALESWLSGLINNATSTVDGSLNDVEAILIKGVLDEVGLQDYYAMHLLDVCSGPLSSTTNPISGTMGTDGKFTATECVTYDDSTGGRFFCSPASRVRVAALVTIWEFIVSRSVRQCDES